MHPTIHFLHRMDLQRLLVVYQTFLLILRGLLQQFRRYDSVTITILQKVALFFPQFHLHLQGRLVMQIHILGPLVHRFPTVASQSLQSSFEHLLTAVFQAVALCPNPYIHCHFPLKHLLEKLLTPMPPYLWALKLEIYKEMPLVGAMLVAVQT